MRRVGQLLWLLYMFATYGVGYRWAARIRHFAATLAVAEAGLFASEVLAIQSFHQDLASATAMLLQKGLWVALLSFGYYVVVHLMGTWWQAMRGLNLYISASDSAGTWQSNGLSMAAAEDRPIRAAVALPRIQQLVQWLHQTFSFRNVLVIEPTAHDGQDFVVMAAAGGEVGDLAGHSLHYDPAWTARYPSREGTYRRALASHKGYTTNNGASDPQFRQMLELPFIRSEIIQPILVDGRPVGVLTANSPQPQAFWLWHEEVLKMAANLISVLKMREDSDRHLVSLVAVVRERLRIARKEGSSAAVLREAVQFAVELYGGQAAVAYGLTKDGWSEGPFVDGAPEAVGSAPAATRELQRTSEWLTSALSAAARRPLTDSTTIVEAVDPPWVRCTPRVRALLALEHDRQAVGVLIIYFTAPHPIFELEQQRLKDLADMLSQALAQSYCGSVIGAAPGGSRRNEAAGHLTSKELEIIYLLSLGHDYARIRAQLYIGSDTLKTHLRNIRRKLGQQDREDLARYWREVLAITPDGRRIADVSAPGEPTPV